MIEAEVLVGDSMRETRKLFKPTLIDEIADLKNQLRAIKETKSGLELAIARKTAKLLEHMTEGGIKTQEGSEYLASRVVKREPRLVDESKALEWLANVPEKEHYIGLKWVDFKLLAQQAYNQDGEIAGGCEIVEKQSISIREKK